MRRTIRQGVRLLGFGAAALWIAAVPLALVVAARQIGLAQIANARAADVGAYIEVAVVAIVGAIVASALGVVLALRPDHRPWLVSVFAALAVIGWAVALAGTDRALVMPLGLAILVGGAILVVSLVGLGLSLAIAPPLEPDRRRPPFVPPFAHHPG
ncbi:MAG: hypothetical protein ACHQZR_00445 [Candidatus Limnocylindrales bacterium]